MSRIAGVLNVAVNGELHQVVGNWTRGLGTDKRETLVGPDGPHGHKSMPQVPFCEGELRDRADLDLRALYNVENAEITLELANGKTFVLHEGFYAGEGTATSEEATINARFEGTSAEEF